MDLIKWQLNLVEYGLKSYCLVISNWTRSAVRSFGFEFMHMISDQIAFHSLPLHMDASPIMPMPLLIYSLSSYGWLCMISIWF